jgi:hypothetical protein
MSVTLILREKAMRLVPLALLVNLIGNLVRLLFHEDFYETFANGSSSRPATAVALVCGSIGFLVSILTLVYSLKCLKGGWRVIAVIGSLLTGYWWLSDVVWWFMPN